MNLKNLIAILFVVPILSNIALSAEEEVNLDKAAKLDIFSETLYGFNQQNPDADHYVYDRNLDNRTSMSHLGVAFKAPWKEYHLNFFRQAYEVFKDPQASRFIRHAAFEDMRFTFERMTAKGAFVRFSPDEAWEALSQLEQNEVKDDLLEALNSVDVPEIAASIFISREALRAILSDSPVIVNARIDQATQISINAVAGLSPDVSQQWDQLDMYNEQRATINVIVSGNYTSTSFDLINEKVLQGLIAEVKLGDLKLSKAARDGLALKTVKDHSTICGRGHANEVQRDYYIHELLITSGDDRGFDYIDRFDWWGSLSSEYLDLLSKNVSHPDVRKALESMASGNVIFDPSGGDTGGAYTAAQELKDASIKRAGELLKQK